jgi:hypothetical protein
LGPGATKCRVGATSDPAPVTAIDGDCDSASLPTLADNSELSRVAARPALAPCDLSSFSHIARTAAPAPGEKRWLSLPPGAATGIAPTGGVAMARIGRPWRACRPRRPMSPPST